MTNKTIFLLFMMIFFFGSSNCYAKEENLMSNNYLVKAEKLATARWGEGGTNVIFAKSKYSYVESIKHIDLVEIRDLLDNYEAYQIKVYNPISQVAGKPFINYCLVINIKDNSVRYLENDEEVTKFISDLSYEIKSEKDIRKIISLFELLRGYEIQEQEVTGLRNFWKFNNYLEEPTEWDSLDELWGKKDWDYVISEVNDFWNVSITFLEDSYIHLYLRYTFEITKNGNFKIIMLKGTAKSAYS